MQTYDNKGHCTVLRLKNFNGDYLIIRYTIFNKRIVWVNDRFRKLNINFGKKENCIKALRNQKNHAYKTKVHLRKNCRKFNKYSLFVSEENKIACANYS